MIYDTTNKQSNSTMNANANANNQMAQYSSDFDDQHWNHTISRKPYTREFMGQNYNCIDEYPYRTPPCLPQKLYIPVVRDNVKQHLAFLISYQLMIGQVVDVEFRVNAHGITNAIVTMGPWTYTATSHRLFEHLRSLGEYRISYGEMCEYFVIRAYVEKKQPEQMAQIVHSNNKQEPINHSTTHATRMRVYDTLVLTAINDYVCQHRTVVGFVYPSNCCVSLPLSVYIPTILSDLNSEAAFKYFIEDICRLGSVRRVDFIEKVNGQYAAFLHMHEWYINAITDACGLIFEQSEEVRIHYGFKSDCQNMATRSNPYVILKKMTCEPVPDSTGIMNNAQLEQIVKEKDSEILDLVERYEAAANKQQVDFENETKRLATFYQQKAVEEFGVAETEYVGCLLPEEKHRIEIASLEAKHARVVADLMFMADKLEEMVNVQSTTIETLDDEIINHKYSIALKDAKIREDIEVTSQTKKYITSLEKLVCSSDAKMESIESQAYADDREISSLETQLASSIEQISFLTRQNTSTTLQLEEMTRRHSNWVSHEKDCERYRR